MYAVVEIGGMQWRVAKKDTLRVPKVNSEVGKSIELDRVLLFVDEEKVEIGEPFLDGMKVKATVVAHGKDDKVKVFKKKRRKGYRVLRGHRQDYTEIRIDAIGAAKAAPKTPKATPKQETAKKDASSKKPSPANKPAEPKTESKSKTKPAPAAASTSKKTTRASATAKKSAPEKASDGKKEG